VGKAIGCYLKHRHDWCYYANSNKHARVCRKCGLQQYFTKYVDEINKRWMDIDTVDADAYCKGVL
jgi:hypothetical protein